VGSIDLLARAALDPTLVPEARARAATAVARTGPDGRARLAGARDRAGDPVGAACAEAAIAGALGPAGEDARRDAETFTRHASPLVRGAAAWALAIGVGGGPGANGAAIVLRDPDPDARLEAARALAAIGRPGAGGLGAALGDADARVRREAARGLARAREPGQAGALVLALARARRERARDPEASALEQDEVERALRPILTEGAGAIATQLRSKDPLARDAAFEALAAARSDDAVSLLMPLLVVPEREQRDLAARAIGRATGRDLFDSMWRPARGGGASRP
jgi:HEAT repeat protein